MLMWHIRDGELIQTLQEEGLWARSLEFSPDGQTLAMGIDDQSNAMIQLRRVSDGELLQTLRNGYRGVTAFSPDWQMLATSAREYSFETAGEVILYRVSDGEQLQTLSQHISGVASIAFSPDGRLLATGSNDGIVRLWGIADQP